MFVFDPSDQEIIRLISSSSLWSRSSIDNNCNNNAILLSLARDVVRQNLYCWCVASSTCGNYHMERTTDSRPAADSSQRCVRLHVELFWQHLPARRLAKKCLPKGIKALTKQNKKLPEENFRRKKMLSFARSTRKCFFRILSRDHPLQTSTLPQPLS